jgi:hypothetical protein
MHRRTRAVTQLRWRINDARDALNGAVWRLGLPKMKTLACG